MPAPTQQEYLDALEVINEAEAALIDSVSGCFDEPIAALGALAATLSAALDAYPLPGGGQAPAVWSTINSWRAQAESFRMSTEALNAQLGSLEAQYHPEPAPPAP